MRGSKPRVVLVSSPGLGHVIPVLELGNRLVTHCGFDVTIFVASPQTSSLEAETLRSAKLQGICRIAYIQPVEIAGHVEPDATVVTKLAVTMRAAAPALRLAMRAVDPTPNAFIVDLFGTELLPIADEIGVPKFVFIASQAWFLALTVHVPVLDELVKGEYVLQSEPLEIPGCRPVQPDEVVDPMLDRADQQYREYVRIGLEIPKSDGILVSTWEELQGVTLAAFKDKELLGQLVRAPVYPIGPITRPVEQDGTEHEVRAWLDRQPAKSVIYVSFGSGGTLSIEQMSELAYGLEMSQQRFVWVVRPPTTRTGDGSFLNTGSGDEDSAHYMPKQFLDRTREVGLVITHWAPQVQILAHPSTGGFLSHGGWNSALESICSGVPMIVWPMYAEQRMNATLLVEELGVAIRPKILPAKGVIHREEICMMVRKTIADEDGQSVRDRAKELKHSAERALNGGSSYKALAEWSRLVS